MIIEFREGIIDSKKEELNRLFNELHSSLRRRVENGELTAEQLEIRVMDFMISNPEIKDVKGFETL